MQQNWLILPSYTKVVRVSKLTKSRRMQSHFADPRGFEKERPSKNKAALGHIFSLLIIHFLYKMQHQKTKGFFLRKDALQVCQVHVIHLCFIKKVL